MKAEEAHRTLLNDSEKWWRRPIGMGRRRSRARATAMPSVDGKRPRNLLHSRLRTFFEWCTKPQIGKLAVSPMFGIDKPFNDEQRRERNRFKGAAGDQAIKTLWHVADKLPAVDVCCSRAKGRGANRAETRRLVLECTEGKQEQTPASHSAVEPGRPDQASGHVFANGDGRISVEGALTKMIIAAGAMDDFFLLTSAKVS